MGQLPYNYITPEGYTDYAALWKINLLERWNLAKKVATNVVPGVQFNLDAVLQQNNVEPKVPAILKFYANLLYGRDMTDQEAAIISSYVSDDTDISSQDGRITLLEAIGLMLSAPAFQRR